MLAGRSGDFGIGWDEGIESEKRFGGLVVPLHDGEGFGFSKRFAPAVVEPVGMGVEDWGRKVIELFEQAFAVGDGFAQDCIDERTDAGFSGFHSFVHSGVVGDVEDEDLAEANAEDVAGISVEFALAEFANPVIQYAAVAKHAKQDGLKQSAVGGGKHASLGVAIDQSFRVVVAFRPCSECGDGGLADVEVLSGHYGKV